MKKDVRIIGLSVNNQIGIIKAHKLNFNEENRLIVFKGAVGEGKTTEQKIIQLGTQGTKTLTDKSLYGEIDTETQLVDGDVNIWVGCRSKDGKLEYSLYTKDDNGKTVKNPVIDGVKATPAKYLETLQTELTWNMDKLTSENPTIQRDILLQLYQHEFRKLGVIFDKKSTLYPDSILGRIDAADKGRDLCDAKRKQVGGIKEDLKIQGFDIERPDTLPVWVDVKAIENNIQNLNTEKALLNQKNETAKETKLLNLKQKGSELVNKCLQYNSTVEKNYKVKFDEYNDALTNKSEIDECLSIFNTTIDNLKSLDGISENNAKIFKSSLEPYLIPVIVPTKPTEPKLIEFSDDKTKVLSLNSDEFIGTEAEELVKKVFELKAMYQTISMAPIEKSDFSEIDAKINLLLADLTNANNINKIVTAIDAFNEWQKSDIAVKELKLEYRNLLKQIDTGVPGLKIQDENDDLYLMYNGEWDCKYFNNEELEHRKVSSYSGTQKPIICLLIQNYLLNRKPKAMRYMYIDNVPIDNKTRDLLEKMCEELNLRIFLNITGDFDKESLQDGEILIEGGELIIND